MTPEIHEATDRSILEWQDCEVHRLPLCSLNPTRSSSSGPIRIGWQIKNKIYSLLTPWEAFPFLTLRGVEGGGRWEVGGGKGKRGGEGGEPVIGM